MPGIGNHKKDEETRSILRAAARECSAIAMRQAKEQGLTVTVAEGNRLVKVAPDGARTELKALVSPKMNLAKGSRVNYR